MPLIYFLRHGQTDWNAARRFQGQLDISMNEAGRVQARRNGRVLAEAIAAPADFLFLSSPLQRASETMEILLGEMGLDPKGYMTDSRLREIHAGDWQGRPASEIFDGPDPYGGDRWNFLYPGAGGESYAMLSARVLEWFGGIERDTVVTAHGGVMRCIRRHLERLDAEAAFKLDVPQDKVLRIDNGALSWM